MKQEEVFLPKFGMQMTEATVVRWLKTPGEAIAVGEPLCIIETDKVETEVEAEVPGKLTAINVAEGTTIPVGTVLAVIEVTE
jgi:pyruvate/2-oxoglutarate dehydrogenase complex dihydrolipoamide acyltransferase (E2) component